MLVGQQLGWHRPSRNAKTRRMLKTGIGFVPDKAQEIADIQKNPHSSWRST